VSSPKKLLGEVAENSHYEIQTSHNAKYSAASSSLLESQPEAITFGFNLDSEEKLSAVSATTKHFTAIEKTKERTVGSSLALHCEEHSD
jgi:hypothetical protein